MNIAPDEEKAIFASMPSQIRICYFCDGYPPERKVGGVEIYTQTIARGLVKRGHLASVVGFSEKVKSVTIENDEGVRVIRIPELSGGKFSNLIRRRLLIESKIRHEVKVSHLNLVETQDCGAPLLRGSFGVPLIIRMQGANFVYFANSGRYVSPVSIFFQKRIYKLADHLVAVSDHIRRETIAKAGLKNRECELIYNAVDINLFKPDPMTKREDGNILFVGRLSQTKGAPNLFKALPTIFSNYPTARLRFIGKNPINERGEPASTELLASLPEEFRGRVELCGEMPHENLPAEYQRASVAVFPSLVEANPFAVLESMACATPTVFMSSGPGPETIEHGEEGLLCDTKDPKAIAEAIMEMLKNPDRAQEMGYAGRLRVHKQFSLDNFIDKNEKYYKTCILN